MKHEVILSNIRNIGCSRKVIIDGITYSSVNQMRMALGLSESEISRYKKEGLSYEEAIDKTLIRKEEREIKRRQKFSKYQKEIQQRNERKLAKQISYNGIIYADLKSACDSMFIKYSITITPSYVKKKAKQLNRPISEVFARVVTLRRRKLYEARKVYHKTYGKFFGMRMKDVYKLMDNYRTTGNFETINSKEYISYLAKEVGITKRQAERFVQDYNVWRHLF